MGLNTTHNCYDGSYSRFNDFRRATAESIGMDLNQYWKGYKEWPTIESEPLVALFDHSDCGGDIEVEHLLPLAKRLREVHGQMDKWWQERYKDDVLKFAKGCEEAAEKGEKVEFH